MKALIFRAHKLCNLPEDLQGELLFLISYDFPPRGSQSLFNIQTRREPKDGIH